MHVNNLFCIVGFPNISKFASVTDPIIGGSDVQTFLNQLKGAEASSNAVAFGGASIMSNSIMTQQAMPAARPSARMDALMSDANQADTDNGDLHLYEFKNVLLEKKERLIVPVFDIELPYKDVYHCEIKEADVDVYFAHQHVEPKDFEEVRHPDILHSLINSLSSFRFGIVSNLKIDRISFGPRHLSSSHKGSTNSNSSVKIRSLIH